jgi:hypothetical protein
MGRRFGHHDEPWQEVALLWECHWRHWVSEGIYAEVDTHPLTMSSHTMIPPRGYSIAGVTGSCGAWVDGFGIILTR